MRVTPSILVRHWPENSVLNICEARAKDGQHGVSARIYSFPVLFAASKYSRGRAAGVGICQLKLSQVVPQGNDNPLFQTVQRHDQFHDTTYFKNTYMTGTLLGCQCGGLDLEDG